MINSVSSNNSANMRACLNSSSNSREEVDERISSQLKILRSQILTKEDKLKLAVCVIRREHFSEEELLPIPLQERLQSLMPSGFRGRRFCFEVSCLVQSKIGYNELDDDGKEKIEQEIERLQTKVSDEKERQEIQQMERLRRVAALERTHKKRKLDNPNIANKQVHSISSNLDERCKKISLNLRFLGSKFLSEPEKLELAKVVIWRENFSTEELSELQKTARLLMPWFVGRTQEFCSRVFESIRLEKSYDQLSSDDKLKFEARIAELRRKIREGKQKGSQKQWETKKARQMQRAQNKLMLERPQKEEIPDSPDLIHEENSDGWISDDVLLYDELLERALSPKSDHEEISDDWIGGVPLDDELLERAFSPKFDDQCFLIDQEERQQVVASEVRNGETIEERNSLGLDALSYASMIAGANERLNAAARKLRRKATEI